nr:hypothetical protein CFP56_28958 [Quercus suber]
MANEKIDDQDRVNQYDGEEYEDSSSLLMSMEDLVSLCGVGSGVSSSGSNHSLEELHPDLYAYSVNKDVSIKSIMNGPLDGV